MRHSTHHWKKLETEFSAALEVLDSVEASARRRGATEEIEKLRPARTCADEVSRALAQQAGNSPNDWKAWVLAETAWIELQFEMRRLVAAPGTLREAFLAGLATRIAGLDGEIDGLVASSDGFRPRTRVAISQDAQRLHRRLDVLREEAGRVGKSGHRLDELAVRSVGHAWSAVEWGLQETKKRFARPRWRQGREAPERRPSA